MKKILLFLLTFLACTYSAQAVDMKLACEDSSWGSTSWVFTNNGDGTWTYVIEDASTLAGDQFKILDSDGKWYGCGDSNGAISFGIGTTNGLYSNNENNVKFDSALSGKVVLTVSNYSVNGWGNSINLSVTDGTSSYTDLWLRGAWTSDWKTEDAYHFKTTDGVTYTLTDVDGATVKGKQWQIANSDWSYKYGSSSTIYAEGTYTLVFNNNQGFDSSFPDGTYDLVYNYNTYELNITKQGTTPDPEPTYPAVIYYYPGMTQIAAKDQANGIYEATLTLGENASFRFYSDESKPDAASYGPNTLVDGSGNNYEAYTLGETRGMTLTSTNRWQLTNTAGEYTFTVDLKNLTFTVVAKSTEYTKYYLRGEINDWATSEAWELKTTDGITYTLSEVDIQYGTKFKIGTGEAENWTGFGWGSGSETREIWVGEPEYDIYIKTGDNAANDLKFGGVIDRKVNITFRLDETDTNKAYIKIENVDAAEITYPELYLRGDFSGEWALNDAYKFTRSGDVYTLTVNGNDVKNKQWAIATDGYTYNFGVSEAITVTDGTKLSWNTNSGAQAGFGELEDAKYDLEYTYSTQTLKVTKQGAVVTYPDLWLRGGFNSTNWGVDDKYKFTCTDGVYTLTGVTGLSNCEFKIGSNETGEGVDWTYGFGGTATDGVTAIIGEAFTVYDVVQGKNISIAENSYTFDIKFVPDFANKTGALTISINDPSGIEDVEISNEAPVEFYNLQGVRVDGELTPGLYIRRQGNSASKVLIR